MTKAKMKLNLLLLEHNAKLKQKFELDNPKKVAEKAAKDDRLSQLGGLSSLTIANGQFRGFPPVSIL